MAISVSQKDRSRIIYLFTRDRAEISGEAAWPQILDALQTRPSDFLDLETIIQWGHLLRNLFQYRDKISPATRIRRLCGFMTVYGGPWEPVPQNPRFDKFCVMSAEFMTGRETPIGVLLKKTWPYLKVANFRAAVSEPAADTGGRTVSGEITASSKWVIDWDKSAAYARLEGCFEKWQTVAVSLMIEKLKAIWLSFRQEALMNGTPHELQLFSTFARTAVDIATENQISQSTFNAELNPLLRGQDRRQELSDLHRRVANNEIIAKKILWFLTGQRPESPVDTSADRSDRFDHRGATGGKG